MSDVFQRLLLATEHSEQDAGAEALALTLARRCGSPLSVVLPLLSNPEYETQAPQLAARAEADAAGRLQHLLAQAQEVGVALDARVRRGPEAWAEIVAEAGERCADLIVIRRRGRRGLLARLLVGEMVRNVVSHAPCSVLVVPRSAGMWARSVLVALDPAVPETAPLGAAAVVAQRCGLPLSIVCVATASGDAALAAGQALQRALAFAAEQGLAATAQLRQGRPHEQIVAAARETGADLLVIGRSGNESLAHAWLGGVAQKVIGLSELPVLVCAPAVSIASTATQPGARAR